MMCGLEEVVTPPSTETEGPLFSLSPPLQQPMGDMWLTLCPQSVSPGLGCSAGAPGPGVGVGRVTRVTMITGPACPFACASVQHTPGFPAAQHLSEPHPESLPTQSVSVAHSQGQFLLFATKISDGY